MKLSYYPGCSLEATARNYQESISGVCGQLGIELEEIPDWSCCGASAAHSTDESLSIALPGRNLALAETIGRDMVVPCPLCFNRLKTAEYVLKKGAEGDPSRASRGKIKIWDLLDFLTQPDHLPRIRDKVQQPLKGLTVVSYYGCMANRPPIITETLQPENPQNMDILLKTLGATVLDWSYKTDCCGASHLIARPDVVHTMVQRLYEKAIETGADAMVVSCQMCQANLDIPQSDISEIFRKPYNLPIYYYTELIGIAWREPAARKWLSRHLVDPEPLLRQKGLV
jgi:heterodisulfide reductase subunit B2